MSSNNINTLCRIDQAIRGLNDDGTDDSYVPAQSANGALERIEKSIKELDIKGIKSGLPKVTNKDNGKVLQVKNGKWAKGEEKLVYISSDSFLDDFHAFSENDTLYLVSGEIEEDARLNESIESEAASEGIVSYYPTVIPPEENHEPWRAFHDDDEYNGWTTKYDNEGNSAYIQYNFQNDFGVTLSGIEFNTTYTYLGEEPAPEELPKIHLELELQVCDDSIHHNWTTIWAYDHEVNDDGWFGTRVIPTDHIYAVRLVCKNSIYNDNAMVTVGDFKFVGMVLNEESESREIWYKGHKFGNVGEGGSGSSIVVIEGTKNSEGTTVTLDKSFSEIKALIEDGNMPIIAVAGLPYAGKNYYVLYNKYDGTTVNEQVNFIFSGTDCRYNSVTNELEIKNIRLGLDETENNVARVINNNANVTFGPTRVCLYQATDYEHAKLWSSDNWNNTSTWITLADGHTIDEFDEIQIVSMTSEGDQPAVHRYDNLVTYIVNAEDLEPQTGSTDNVKARIFWQSKQSGQQRNCDLTFTHDLTKVHPASSPEWYVIIYAIYGIKY